MTRILRIILIVITATAAASAQDRAITPCPSVTITGELGKERPPVIAKFVAKIDAKGWPGPFAYRWEVGWTDPNTEKRTSTNFLGQGTSSISVPNPQTGILASLDIEGFPSGCANKASEVIHWDAAPTAFKLAELSRSSELMGKGIAERIVEEINKYPGSQLFVFSGHEDGISQVEFSRHLRLIFWQLNERGLDRNRITFRTVTPGSNIVQFWRVPSGAVPPLCLECAIPGVKEQVLECPLIFVSGPAGVTKPGEPMVFTASTSSLARQVVRKWEVTGGELQRQSADRIEVSWTLGRNITATLHVSGLPEGCPTSYSDTAGIAN